MNDEAQGLGGGGILGLFREGLDGGWRSRYSDTTSKPGQWGFLGSKSL